MWEVKVILTKSIYIVDAIDRDTAMNIVKISVAKYSHIGISSVKLIPNSTNSDSKFNFEDRMKNEPKLKKICKRRIGL